MHPRHWWPALALVGCGSKPRATDSAPPPPAEACEADHAESEDEVMAFWDASLADTVALFPRQAAGPAWRLDGREGEAGLSLRWLPGSLRYVSWHDIDGECRSHAATEFAVDRLTVDGVGIDVQHSLSSVVWGAGGGAPVADLILYAAASGVTGTALEPPSGRDAVGLVLELTGVVPAGPDAVAWRIRGWVDEPTGYGWDSVQTEWPLFAAELQPAPE